MRFALQSYEENVKDSRYNKVIDSFKFNVNVSL